MNFRMRALRPIPSLTDPRRASWLQLLRVPLLMVSLLMVSAQRVPLLMVSLLMVSAQRVTLLMVSLLMVSLLMVQGMPVQGVQRQRVMVQGMLAQTASTIGFFRNFPGSLIGGAFSSSTTPRSSPPDCICIGPRVHGSNCFV